MDWSSATEEEDRRMLKGIVALLLSFACLAERACAAPSFVRRLVLAILTRAEAVAREFVTGTAMDRDVPACIPASQAMTANCRGDSCADAMRLAHIFRALAALLARLANRNSGDRPRRSKFAAGAISSLLAEARKLQFVPLAARLAVERIDSS